MVTGGGDGRVRLWQLDQPGRPTELGSRDGSWTAVAVAPQTAAGVVTGAATGGCGCGTSTNPAGPPNWAATRRWPRWRSPPTAVGWSPAGTTGGCGCGTWTSRTGPPSWAATTVRWAVAVAPDGSWVVTGGDDGRMLLWHLDQPGRPTELRRHDQPVAAMAVAPDGRLGGHRRATTGGFCCGASTSRADPPSWAATTARCRGGGGPPDGSLWSPAGRGAGAGLWRLSPPSTCIAEINAACAALAVSTHTLHDTVLAIRGPRTVPLAHTPATYLRCPFSCRGTRSRLGRRCCFVSCLGWLVRGPPGLRAPPLNTLCSDDRRSRYL